MSLAREFLKQEGDNAVVHVCDARYYKFSYLVCVNKNIYLKVYVYICTVILHAV